MRTLSIDIETYSPISLAKAGVYKYVDDPDFQILLFSYAIDDGEVQTVDLSSGEQIPADVLSALDDPQVVKWAFNASFKRTCLSAYLGHRLDPTGWRCSMVWTATLGLPLSLKDVGAVLNLDAQKMSEAYSPNYHIKFNDDYLTGFCNLLSYRTTTDSGYQILRQARRGTVHKPGETAAGCLFRGDERRDVLARVTLAAFSLLEIGPAW